MEENKEKKAGILRVNNVNENDFESNKRISTISNVTIESDTNTNSSPNTNLIEAEEKHNRPHRLYRQPQQHKHQKQNKQTKQNKQRRQGSIQGSKPKLGGQTLGLEFLNFQFSFLSESVMGDRHPHKK